MTALESINLTYEMYQHYQEHGYDEATSVELAVQDMMRIMDKEARIVGRN